jgi:uncharacterized protein
MQMERVNVQVFRPFCHIDCGQNKANTLDVSGEELAGVIVFVEPLQALVAKTSNHSCECKLLIYICQGSARGRAVYRFFRDELEARYLQFIPIVERINDDGCTLLQQGDRVTDRSVTAERYGQFLIEVFDEWVRHDVGSVFVQTVDAVLAAWVYGQSSLCMFRPACGEGVALEHNGDLYSCDHFVEPKYLLGNILHTPLAELVNSERQRRFGEDKSGGLPRYCRECRFLFECYGECPKNRFLLTPDGEAGMNYLRAGLRKYFGHVDPYMRMMAGLLSQGRPASEIMDILRMEEAQMARPFAHAGRNDLCPCGSGHKHKKCHADGGFGAGAGPLR